MRRLGLLLATGTLAVPGRCSCPGGWWTPRCIREQRHVDIDGAELAAATGSHRPKLNPLAAAGEEALCLSCHDGTGASTNVELGVQYIPTGLVGAGEDLGALRNGGFLEAQLATRFESRIPRFGARSRPGFRARDLIAPARPRLSDHHDGIAGQRRERLGRRPRGRARLHVVP